MTKLEKNYKYDENFCVTGSRTLVALYEQVLKRHEKHSDYMEIPGTGKQKLS